MATVTHYSHSDGPWQRVNHDQIVVKQATRIYANGDIVKGPILGIGAIITADTCVANDQLDSDGTPAAVGVLEVTDGSTTQALVNVSASTLGAAAGGVTFLNVPGALGWVAPTAGYWIQFRITTGPDVGVTGVVRFAVGVTAQNYNRDDPTRPTG